MEITAEQNGTPIRQISRTERTDIFEGKIKLKIILLRHPGFNNFRFLT